MTNPCARGRSDANSALSLAAPVHDVVLLARLKAEEEAAAARSADNWRWGQPLTAPLLEHVE
jgi:hypothetical protein